MTNREMLDRIHAEVIRAASELRPETHRPAVERTLGSLASRVQSIALARVGEVESKLLEVTRELAAAKVKLSRLRLELAFRADGPPWPVPGPSDN